MGNFNKCIVYDVLCYYYYLFCYNYYNNDFYSNLCYFYNDMEIYNALDNNKPHLIDIIFVVLDKIIKLKTLIYFK
jgi:hypothetical protein